MFIKIFSFKFASYSADKFPIPTNLTYDAAYCHILCVYSVCVNTTNKCNRLYYFDFLVNYLIITFCNWVPLSVCRRTMYIPCFSFNRKEDRVFGANLRLKTCCPLVLNTSTRETFCGKRLNLI